MLSAVPLVSEEDSGKNAVTDLMVLLVPFPDSHSEEFAVIR